MLKKLTSSETIIEQWNNSGIDFPSNILCIGKLGLLQRIASKVIVQVLPCC